MKTAEERIKQRIEQIALDKSSSPSDWRWIEGYMLEGYNIAMEEYLSPHQELPSDDRMVVEILNKIVIHSKQCRPTESGHGIVVALANECLSLLSDRSPNLLLASRDARILELEEENKKLKDYINPPKKDSFFDGLKVGQRD